MPIHTFFAASCSIETITSELQENYVMLNTTLDDYKLNVHGGSGCQLRLLVVGRGGHGNVCGGGSGFIQYHTIPELSKTYSPYTVSVSINRTSSVTIVSSNLSGFEPVVITALAGQDASTTKGGDGYSGGNTYTPLV